MKRFPIIIFLLVVITLLITVGGCSQPRLTPEPPASSDANNSPVVPTTQQLEVFKLRAATHQARVSDGFQMFEQWAKDLEKASNGRLQIEVASGGEIVPVLEMWEATSKGIIDITDSYGAFWLGKTQMAALSVGLAYTTQSHEDQSALLLEYGIRDMIRDAYAEQNIYLLRQMPVLRTSMMTNFEVNEVADLKGKVIRATGPIADMLTEAGASTVFFPGAEIYGALERGAIDGVVYGPLASQYELGFHEVTDAVMPGFALESEEIIMNLDTWNKLPEDLQELLYMSVGHLREVWDARYRANEIQVLKELRESGKTITYLPESEKKIMAMHMLTVMENRAVDDAIFLDATKILKSFMQEAGYLK